MRSAEQSDVGTTRFDASGNGTSAATRPGLAIRPAAPASLAPAAILAFALAVLFVVTDVTRTVDDAAERLALHARHFAAEIAVLGPGEARVMVAGLGRRFPDFDVHVTDLLGRLAFSTDAESVAGAVALRDEAVDGTIWAEAPVRGPYGTVTVAVDPMHAALPALQRALVAGGGVLALVLLAVRARRAEPAPAPARGHDRTAAVIESIPYGVACWSRSGKLLICNDHFRDRVRGDGPGLRPGADYAEFVRRFARDGSLAVTGEDEHKRLIEMHGADGTCLLVDERPSGDGGFVTLVSDITDRKRADELLNMVRQEQRDLARRYHEEKIRAEAASRSKTSFLAHISHDIRTPLNHIIGFADLIRHQTYGPVGDARYLGYIDDIKASGEKLLASFADILELAELESGSKLQHPERIGVGELLEDVHERFCAGARQAGVALEVTRPSEALVMGDRYCLLRMLGNLVENAIRFTPSGGRISLAAWIGADGVVLEVTDTGIGIPAERLDTLSQPFVLGDAAFTRGHDGTGLGIAIARAIAEMSGGHLAIDSRPSLGTTVAVSLPIEVADDGGARDPAAERGAEAA